MIQIEAVPFGKNREYFRRLSKYFRMGIRRQGILDKLDFVQPRQIKPTKVLYILSTDIPYYYLRSMDGGETEDESVDEERAKLVSSLESFRTRTLFSCTPLGATDPWSL